MISRRSLLAAALAPEKSLREIADGKKMYFGAAASWPLLRDDALYAKHFAAECNMLVPENVLKMGPVHPEPERYNFEPADFMAAFCQKHGMKMRGHTLVWHSQTFPWFKEKVTNENARRILEEHVRTVAGRYRGKIDSWDVVNEAIEVKDGVTGGLRKSQWLEVLGPEFIDMAFKAAREADPAATLVYNDYGLDYADAGSEAKRAAVLKLLHGMQERKVPLDGFGTQAHLNIASREKFNPDVLRKFLGEVASLGLKIYVTELDVIDQALPDDIEARDKGVAEFYEAYLTAALDVKEVVAVLTWGLTDKYSWLARRHPRPSGAPIRPLPLDSEYNRKPAWRAIAKTMEGRRG
jgi:endo-1,4-beta-xylanase